MLGSRRIHSTPRLAHMDPITNLLKWIFENIAWDFVMWPLLAALPIRSVLGVRVLAHRSELQENARRDKK